MSDTQWTPETMGRKGGAAKSERKAAANRQNGKRPKGQRRNAIIEQVDGETVIVKYRGVTLHTETVNPYQVSGAKVNQSVREANDRAEAWAKANGFTGIRWQ